MPALPSNFSRMKDTPSHSSAEPPGGPPNFEAERGYPSGPQRPSGEPRGGKPPRPPGDTKPTRANRTRIIKIRLTTAEMNELAIPLPVKAGVRRGLSRLVRSRLFGSNQMECSTYDCRQCRLLASV